LVQQGLIERKISDHDSRAVNLRLTPAGRKVHRKVWLCLEGFVDAIEGRIPEKKRKLVYWAVNLFIDAVKKASSACPCSE
jgi:DNA-binding MarR family transcriptional regulator